MSGKAREVITHGQPAAGGLLVRSYWDHAWGGAEKFVLVDPRGWALDGEYLTEEAARMAAETRYEEVSDER